MPFPFFLGEDNRLFYEPEIGEQFFCQDTKESIYVEKIPMTEIEDVICI